jgi:hypothetical protein
LKQVTSLLSASSTLDNKTHAFLFTAAHGHLALVQMLLADACIDPSTKNNRAIRFASTNGHAAIVQLLLAHPKVDPSANFNYAIRSASVKGHDEVARLLLAHPKVDPSAEGNEALLKAVEHNHEHIATMLLAHPKVDPSADFNDAVVLASDQGNAAMVQRLLEHPRVDASAQDNKALRWAIFRHHTETVRVLLDSIKVVQTHLQQQECTPGTNPDDRDDPNDQLFDVLSRLEVGLKYVACTQQPCTRTPIQPTTNTRPLLRPLVKPLVPAISRVMANDAARLESCTTLAASFLHLVTSQLREQGDVPEDLSTHLVVGYLSGFRYP